MIISLRSNQAITLVDQALVSGVNFGLAIFLARVLGADGFGVFTLIWMVVLFLSGLQHAAIISPLFSLHSKQDDPSAWLQNLRLVQLLFCLASCVLIFLALLIYVQLSSSLSNSEVGVVSVLSAAYLFNDFFRRHAFTVGQPFKVLIMDTVGFGLQLPLLWCVNHWFSLSINHVLFILTMCFILANTYFLYTVNYTLKWKGSLSVLTEVWQYSKFLIGNALLQWFSSNYFILSAGVLLGTTSVGVIRMGQNIMGVFHVLFLALENIVPLRAAHSYRTKGLSALLTYIKETTLKFGVLVALLLCIISVFSSDLLGLIYGADAQAYGNILMMYCGVYALVFIGTQLRFLIRTLEKNHVIFWSYIATSAFGVGCASLLIQSMGILGAPLGILISHVLSLFIFLFYLKTSLKWTFKLSM